jgi:hypothetical protein
MSPTRPFRAPAAVAVLLLLATRPAATWSIVAVNTRTGEVCISSATCLPRTDLTKATPTLVVGHGAGVVQALVDPGIDNRLRMRDGLLAGDSPQEILDLIEELDPGFQARQIGLVDLDIDHDPVSFTGNGAGRAKGSIAGRVGDVAYAIQGNVLTGREVLDAAEAALRASTGDLGQRVLAGMIAARELGGDGRCSCGLQPTVCGVPPPDFEKSAHCGFLIVARVGDTDGPCTVPDGCAAGDYYLDINIRGANAYYDDPDPVDQIVARYTTWRGNRQGRPDGILSQVEAVDSLPADGATEREVRVRLVDVDGQALTHGGATLAVTTESGAPPRVHVGPVTDHGDGSYSFPVRAGTETGTDRLVITAQDEFLRATLYPFLELRSDPPAVLHAGFDAVSAAGEVAVPFAIADERRPRGKFWLFAEIAGADRGLDPLLGRGLVPGVSPFFPAPPGTLDAHGHGSALYRVPPGALVSLIGLRLEWTARLFGRGKPAESNTVGFDVVP